ncbi:HNH endonuclease [Marinovum algicola]|uniref:HNH endonuclease n=1 Tax=Marinovum algicola TaxID=42444 RepID=UPI003B51D84F
MGRKVCSATGCEDLAIEGRALCGQDQARADQRRKDRAAAAQRTPWAAAARKLYDHPDWKRMAKNFLRKHPLCADCEDLGVVEPSTDVDHIIPHRGNRRRFWDQSNWQALCHRCHSRKTAREVFHRRGPGVPRK